MFFVFREAIRLLIFVYLRWSTLPGLQTVDSTVPGRQGRERVWDWKGTGLVSRVDLGSCREWEGRPGKGREGFDTRHKNKNWDRQWSVWYRKRVHIVSSIRRTGTPKKKKKNLSLLWGNPSLVPSVQ